MEGDVAVEGGKRLLQFDDLLAGADPVAKQRSPRPRLLDCSGDRRGGQLTRRGPLRGIPRGGGGGAGFGQRPLGDFQLTRRGGEFARPATQRGERPLETGGKVQLGERIDRRPGGAFGDEEADEARLAELLAEASGSLSGGGGCPRGFGGEPLEARLLLAPRGHDGALLPDRDVGGVRFQLARDPSPNPLPLRRHPGQVVASFRRQLPGVEVGVDQRRRLELEELVGGPAPGVEERLERDHRPDRVLGVRRGLECLLQLGDLRVDSRELAPQRPRTDRGGPHRRQARERRRAALTERFDRRHLRIGGVKALDRVAETVEDARHPAAVEAACQFVEPAAASFGGEGVELLELVEPEGHHGREGLFVDFPHVVLEEEGRRRAAIGRRDGEMVGDGEVLLGGVVSPREALQMRSLMAPLHEDPPAVDAGTGQELAATGGVGIEDAAAEEVAEAEEHSADELEE